MYPSNQDYKLALMIGADSFRTLENIEILSHPLYPTEPWFATGGLAIVFKIKYQGKLFALKCFTKESAERQERLLAISDYLKQNPNPYFVDFTYLENELWVENENGGEGYPVVLMKWVEGLTLDNYLKKVCANEDKPTLKRLYDNFGRLILWIQAQPIAHGDLKHDNILVMPDGQLKLIDYDGMYIPAFLGLKATELGSPCYQHPLRTAEYFNENLDDFSLLILQITLLSFETEPYLFFDHFNGDGLLFKDFHFLDFEKADLQKLITELPNQILPLLISNVKVNIKRINKIDLNPYLLNLQEEELTSKSNSWILDLLKNKKELFAICISGRYKYKNDYLIKKYPNKIDWYSLSKNMELEFLRHLAKSEFDMKFEGSALIMNEKINWTESLIEEFWYLFSCLDVCENKYLPWPKKILEETVYAQLNVIGYEIYPDFFNVDLPWNENLIALLQRKIEECKGWDSFSSFKKLKWNEYLIEKYKDKWNWTSLSENESIPWTEELVQKFKENWDWETLSSNNFLPWSEKFINLYLSEWDWKKMSTNSSILGKNYIRKFEDFWDWDLISASWDVPWHYGIFKKYKNRLNWHKLSANYSLGWKSVFLEDYFEEFQDLWVWSKLSENYYILSKENFLKEYSQNLDWKAISNFNQALPFEISEELFIKHSSDFNWENLSWVNNLPWSIGFIEKFKEKWNWNAISSNYLPWSFKLLSKFQDKLNWNILSSERDYDDFPWTIDLIENFKNKWNWELLSKNRQLPWSEYLVDKYKENWHWFYLSTNTKLPWSKDFILKYKDKIKWNVNLSHNDGFCNYLVSRIDDSLMEEIMSSQSDFKPVDYADFFYNEEKSRDDEESLFFDYDF